MRTLRERASARGLRSVAVTFEPHPLEVVNPSAAPSLLTPGEEKLEILAETGIDYLAVLPFTPWLAGRSADQFVDEVLCSAFHLSYLLIGHDHGFGRQRTGNVGVLRALGATRGFDVEVLDAVSDRDGRPVSSTAIRRAIAGGDLHQAAAALGRPYSISGTVVPGAGRGRTLGFPTANLELASPRKLLPPPGVYAATVQTPSGPMDGMVNIGPRPTFGDPHCGIEAHLFGAPGDLYGARLRVDLAARLRETRRFAGPSELVAQLQRDRCDAVAALTGGAAAGNLNGCTRTQQSTPPPV